MSFYGFLAEWYWVADGKGMRFDFFCSVADIGVPPLSVFLVREIPLRLGGSVSGACPADHCQGRGPFRRFAGLGLFVGRGVFYR